MLRQHLVHYWKFLMARDKAKFEEKFRFYLERSRYSQVKLAQELGYERDTINKWIRGANQVSVENLYRLCKLFVLGHGERAEFFDLAGQGDYSKLVESEAIPSKIELT